MERNEKKVITTVLMVTGVICILVAGGISVATAWQHMPEILKKCCMLFVAFGLFTGAYAVGRTNKLYKTELALYYMGVAFLGYFTVSVLGGVQLQFPQENAMKWMMAESVMLVPVVLRWLKKGKNFDTCVGILLLDALMVSFICAWELGSEFFVFALGIITLLLSILDGYFQRNDFRLSGISGGIAVMYLLHACIYGFFALIYAGSGVDAEVGLPMIYAGLATAIVAVSAYKRGTHRLAAMRNILFLFDSFVAVNCINSMCNCPISWTYVVFIAFVINTIITVYMLKKEMMVCQMVFAVVVPFVQLINYYFHSFCFLSGRDEIWYTTYVPFSMVVGVACLVLAFRHKYENEKMTKLLQVAGLELLIGCFMILAASSAKFIGFSFCMVMAMTKLFMVVLVKRPVPRSVFMTSALFFGECGVLTQDFVNVSEQFFTEIQCLWIGVGIVLLGYIWYHSTTIKRIQFVLTVQVFTALFFHNLAVSSLANVLLFGLTCVVLLVLASLKNNKPYAILSGVTVTLLVLYITRDFWLSITWWVYLFVAGVVLVILAVKKEKEM